MVVRGQTQIRLAGLTPRQMEVLERVSKRQSLKQIAGELAISESAVNQHIKALKLNLRVNSLPELAESYRSFLSQDPDLPCRKTASPKSGLPPEPENDPSSSSDDNDFEPIVNFRDALTYRLNPPWQETSGSRIVPGVLDGANAKMARVTYMVAVAFGLFAVVLLALGVAQGITTAFSPGTSPAP